METTTGNITQKRLNRKNLSVTSGKVALFIFCHGMINRSVMTPDKIITQVQKEKESMENFGIDTEILLSLAYSFKKGITQSYPKDKLALVVYRYMVYLETNVVNTEVSTIGWLATISAPFQYIFNFPTTLSPKPEIISRLVMQKCMISEVLKDPMAKKAEQNFTSKMVDWARKIKKQFKATTNKFDLVGFTPVDLKEYITCFIEDIVLLKRTEKVDTTTAKKAFFVDGLNTMAIVEIVSKRTSFFAEEAGCSETKMKDWINEYKKPTIDFNIHNDSTIETVFENWFKNGITPVEIFDMIKFNKLMNSSPTGSISLQ